MKNRVPAVFAGSHVLCSFFMAKKTDRNDRFGALREGFETTKSSISKAMVHPSCCAPTMFLQGSYQGCSAEGPGSEDPECPTVDPCRRLPLKLFGDFFYAGKVHLPRCTGGFDCQCAKLRFALCSASNSLSYLKTRNYLK